MLPFKHESGSDILRRAVARPRAFASAPDFLVAGDFQLQFRWRSHSQIFQLRLSSQVQKRLDQDRRPRMGTGLGIGLSSFLEWLRSSYGGDVSRNSGT
jgi:hypothetical protein